MKNHQTGQQRHLSKTAMKKKYKKYLRQNISPLFCVYFPDVSAFILRLARLTMSSYLPAILRLSLFYVRIVINDIHGSGRQAKLVPAHGFDCAMLQNPMKR